MILLNKGDTFKDDEGDYSYVRSIDYVGNQYECYVSKSLRTLKSYIKEGNSWNCYYPTFSKIDELFSENRAWFHYEKVKNWKEFLKK